jgi:DNA-binding NtrC family response regulator
MKNTFEYNWRGKTILVIDKMNSHFCQTEEKLETMGARAIQVASVSDLDEIFQLVRINMVLIDSAIENESGSIFREQIRKLNPFIPVAIISNESMNYDLIKRAV